MIRLLLSCLILCVLAQDKGPKGPQDRWEGVLHWLKKRVPSIHVDPRVVMRPGRFGDQVLSAGDRIEKDEFLLQLPVSTFFWDEECFPSEQFAQLETGYVSSLKTFPKWTPPPADGLDYTQVALCLVIHRLLGNQSVYEPYLRQLPRQTETFMFHNSSEFEVLRGTDTYRTIRGMQKRHEAILDGAKDEMFPMIRDYLPQMNLSDALLREELEQALSLCGSRTFYMDSGMLAPGKNFSFPKFYRPVMVPLIDFVNHGDMRTRNCQYYFNRTHQHFQLQAIRDIEPGEELVMSYGLRANWELAIFYGFIMPGNLEDFVNVIDIAQGALDLSLITQLNALENQHAAEENSASNALECHAPFFRPAAGWPPSYQITVEHASPNQDNTTLSLGPLSPSLYHALVNYLQPPHNATVKKSLMSLGKIPNSTIPKVKTILRVTGKHVHVVFQNGTELKGEDGDNETFASHGALSVHLQWKHTLPSSCTANSSMKAVKCQAKQSSVASSSATTTSTCAVEDETAKIRDDFRLRRRIIRAARLDEYPDKVYRGGLLPKSIAAIKIAVLPTLSAFDIHRILGGGKQSGADMGVTRALTIFCFEELSRRLQVLGVETATNNLYLLLEQSRTLAPGGPEMYDQLARNELEIFTSFCALIADWNHPLWE